MNAPVLQLPAPNPDQRANDNSDESSDGWPSWVTAAATVIIAILTLALACVAWKQRQTYEAQRKLMKAMLKNTQETDRAWINIETLDIESGINRQPVIAIGLKNSGRTPARIIDANVTVRFSRRTADGKSWENLTELDDAPIYDAGTFAPPAILVAGETSRWRYPIGLSDNTYGLSRLNPGEDKRLWIYGKITFTDQFNPSRPHTYGFAREYDPILSASVEPPRFRFAHVNKPAYNYAD